MQNNSPDNHWYILGAGAIACLWAYALGQSGQTVTLIIRDSKFKTNRTGFNHTQTIALTTPTDPKLTKKIEVSLSCPKQLRLEKTAIKRLIVATKAYDAAEALNSIIDSVANDAKILSLSNGMGMHQAMLDIIAAQQLQCQLLLGITSDGALLQQPYQLIHTGIGNTYIGEYSAQTAVNKATLTRHAPRLLPSNFPLKIHYVDNVIERLWQKMLVNCVINPLTLKHQCNNGDLINNPKLNAEIEDLCAELADIYNGEKKHPPLSARDIFRSVQQVAKQTAQNTSSMLTDAQHKRPLELDYLNGHMMDLAQQYGIPCPINRQLSQDIQQLLKSGLKPTAK